VKESYRSRQYIYMLIFGIIAGIFIFRLYQLQIKDKKYKQTADLYTVRRLVQYPARGNILDRRGRLLVANEYAFDLMVILKETTELDSLELCELTDISIEEFRKTLSGIEKRYNGKRRASKPEVVVKELSQYAVAALQEKLYKFPGFFLEKRTIRRFPQPIGAQVLGYIGEADTGLINSNRYYERGDYVGVSGIEKSYEEVLRGIKGVRKIFVDVTGNNRGAFANGQFDTTAIPGKNLVTTLDLDLQAYGEYLMQNKRGAVVAIEPQTGEILALVSAPTYNPNLMAGRNLRRFYPKLLLDENKPMYNRAIKDGYPPGSTFKIFMNLVGQQEEVVFPSTVVPCHGGFRISASQTVGCHGHAPANLQFSVTTSCNAYYCWVFNELIKKYPSPDIGLQVWRDYALKFGFGEPFPSDLPYIKGGNIPTPEYYDRIYRKGGWRGLTIISLGIGQGEVKLNVLQIANLAAIVANRGWYIVPHVGKRVGSEDLSTPSYFPKMQTGIDTSYFPVLIAGMYGAVHEPGGTAKIARVDSLYICGKTGTAQDKPRRDHSVFMAFAPRDKPRIAIAVLVENSGFGATWAAPIASLMIEKYLTDTIKRPDLEERIANAVIFTQNIYALEE
jgi:penicillin-binding protein 2